MRRATAFAFLCQIGDGRSVMPGRLGLSIGFGERDTIQGQGEDMPQTSITVLDPTGESRPEQFTEARRLGSLAGMTVGLLDISKPRGDIFLERIGQRLLSMGTLIRVYQKPTFAKPAPVDLRHQIATECDAVIEALAD